MFALIVISDAHVADIVFNILAQQLDLRLQQACFWPWQYTLVRRRDLANIATTRAQYIRLGLFYYSNLFQRLVYTMLLIHHLHSFYNSMWLVANDIIIGVAIGSYLRNNSEYMAKLIVNDYLGVSMRSTQILTKWLRRHFCIEFAVNKAY